MGFSRISKLQVNVSVTIFLVSNTFQNILDGFASCIAFMVKKIFTKKLLRCTLFLTNFSYLASLDNQSCLENSETSRIIFLEFIQRLVFIFALYTNLKLKADFLSSQKLLATILFERDQSSHADSHGFGAKFLL